MIWIYAFAMIGAWLACATLWTLLMPGPGAREVPRSHRV